MAASVALVCLFLAAFARLTPLSMISFWSSVLIGLALGGGYGVAAYVMSRLALGQSQQRFLALALGGMLLRMVAMLGALGLVLALVTVRPLPFAAALTASLLAGLATEVFVLHRHATST